MLHAKALHGNPFDGHTLGPVIADMEKLTGVEARNEESEKAKSAIRWWVKKVKKAARMHHGIRPPPKK